MQSKPFGRWSTESNVTWLLAMAAMVASYFAPPAETTPLLDPTGSTAAVSSPAPQAAVAQFAASAQGMHPGRTRSSAELTAETIPFSGNRPE